MMFVKRVSNLELYKIYENKDYKCKKKIKNKKNAPGYPKSHIKIR